MKVYDGYQPNGYQPIGERKEPPVPPTSGSNLYHPTKEIIVTVKGENNYDKRKT